MPPIVPIAREDQKPTGSPKRKGSRPIQQINTLKKLYIGLLQLQFDVEASDRLNEIIHRINRFKPSVVIMSQEFIDKEPNLYQNIRQIYNIPIIRLVPEMGAEAAEQDFIVKPLRIIETAEKIRQLMKKK